MQTFGDRVAAAVAATGPLCAGIDPSSDLLAEWGLADDARGVAEFGARCVDAFAGIVPVVKPQVAFFERHGAAGLGALEELLASARAAGLLVIADAKRGDIDSTAAAYADAWLGGSPLAADAVTAHAYLGLGALAPLVATARRHGRGVIVVARSSNPEGRGLQEAVTAEGVSVADSILAGIAALNREEVEALGDGAVLGSVGAVVGATLVAGRGIPLADVGGPLLAPGVGAQGAGPREVAALFAGCRPGGVLPSASRALLRHGPAVDALADAARRTRDEMAVALA